MALLLFEGLSIAYDQVIGGQGWWMGRGNNERYLKRGGGEWGVIKASLQKHLETGGG